MKSYLSAVFLAIATLLLGGCATQGIQQPQAVIVPIQNAQRVTPQQESCSGRGWVDIGTCNRASGVQIPVGQIMQAGSGIGKCELVGGGIGALGGAAVGGKEHRGVGAILGAIVGAFAGNKYCESDVPQVQQVMTQPQNRCSDGKVWAKLDWTGHPQDGNMVCMMSDDPHRAGNSMQSAKVASAEPSRCKDGKVWAKLSWSGHPQDGNMVCVAPDDPHKGN